MNRKLITITAIIIISFSAFYFYSLDKTSTNSQQSPKTSTEVNSDSSKLDSVLARQEYIDKNPEELIVECVDTDSGEEYCEEIDEGIDEELSDWAEETSNNKEVKKEDKEFDSNQSQAIYKVNIGEKISLSSGENKQPYQELWTEFASLSPDTVSDKYIETFEIYSEPNDDTLAFVDDEDNNGKWRVAINLAQHTQSSKVEQKSTLIHELFHIISLNTSQLSQISSCKTLNLDEGCVNQNSYLYPFWNSYWKNTPKPEFSESSFVTEYASTNEVEDLAESFAFFVLEKDKDKLGSEEKDSKIKYFYDYPELVDLRSTIRKTLGTDIIRAKKITNQ